MFSGIIASLLCARERESESFLSKGTDPDDTTRTHAVDVRDGGRTIDRNPRRLETETVTLHAHHMDVLWVDASATVGRQQTEGDSKCRG